MISSYFKIAWRNILRNKLYSTINLMGLTVGISCFLLLFMFVKDELGYDRHHKNADKIYRLNRTFLSTDGSPSLRLGHVAPPFGPLLKNDFPQVKDAVRMYPTNAIVRRGEKIFNESDVFAAEQNLFRVFDFKILRGNPDLALKEPFSVMLSKPMAEKYFGKEDPLGQTLRLNGQYDYKVTGVYDELPLQSTFHPHFLISFSTLNDEKIYGAGQLQTNWGNNAFSLFLLLEPGTDPAALERAFPAFQDKHIGQNTSSYSKLSLTPLTDIHLHSHLDSELEANSDIRYVYYFSAIAIFILLIACINYMNLTTARASKRAREIGLKKVLGVSRIQLIRQFISESFIFTFLALIFGLLLTRILLPYLNRFAGKDMVFSALFSPQNILWLLIFVVFVSLVSGSYPAFYLTGFQPVEVMKSKMSLGQKGGWARQLLVVVQFSIAVLLIGSTIVVYRQLRYMEDFDLGYQKDQVLVFKGGITSSQFSTIRNELKKNSQILEVGRSSRIPTGRLLDSWDTKVIRGDSMAPSDVTVKMLTIDENFLPAYHIKMAAGRNLSLEFPSDSTKALIINESASKMLGWKNPEDAIGKNMIYGQVNGTIVGVTKDYHFESLHQQIPPLVMLMPGGLGPGWVSVRIRGERTPETISHIQSVWNANYPDQPFDYVFLDSRYQDLYALEKTQQTLLAVFAVLAILISCLGLLGLSMYMTGLRTKEIGIRKVLGASTGNVVRLLSFDYIRLVGISILVAVPLTWLIMNKWLQDFAYHVEISWYMMALGGVLAVIVAIATVSTQAFMAAGANPVKTLRAE